MLIALNYYAPRRRDGLFGNATQWAVIDKKLYLRSRDPRNPDDLRAAYWSLDLSGLLVD